MNNVGRALTCAEILLDVPPAMAEMTRYNRKGSCDKTADWNFF